MSILIAQGSAATDSLIERLTEQLDAQAEHNGTHYRLTLKNRIDAASLQRLRNEYPIDINILPDDFEPGNTRLLITDMDSTLISIECIDEIADFLGIKPQVETITDATMRGEIDFETSLKQRIALLDGLDDSALQHVYTQRLTLNPGANEMLAGLQEQGIKIALVSGGFTFFTDKLKQRLGLDYTLANKLNFDAQGKLNGIANDVIVGAQSKAQFLLTLCDELEILPSQVVAMGDGANDLLMMKEAGLSIAYHAKPTVQQQAHTSLNHCGLEGVLGLLDIQLNQ